MYLLVYLPINLLIYQLISSYQFLPINYQLVPIDFPINYKNPPINEFTNEFTNNASTPHSHSRTQADEGYTFLWFCFLTVASKVAEAGEGSAYRMF